MDSAVQMRENRLKWFGHNEKRKNDKTAEKISKIKMKENGKRGRPNKKMNRG